MAKPSAPVNALATVIPKAAPTRSIPQRQAAGPREDAADAAGDGMRPMKPAPISPRHNGRGHMGSFADKMHPVGRR